MKIAPRAESDQNSQLQEQPNVEYGAINRQLYVTLRVEISHMFQNKKIQFLIECYTALF